MSYGTLQPILPSNGKVWLDLGPRDIWRGRENPDILTPPTGGDTVTNLLSSLSAADHLLSTGAFIESPSAEDLPAPEIWFDQSKMKK